MGVTAKTCVVLAGGPRDALAGLDPQAPNKAFLPIAGRALAARTIDALRTSSLIDRIVVVAPASARRHPALASADEVRADGARIVDSLRSGLQGLPPDDLVLVAASDLPLLTAEAIDEFIASANASDADLVYGCVERNVHLAAFPDVPHTWARLREGTYCGAGVSALRPRAFPALERFLERLAAARKNPLALAAIFGWGTLMRYACGRLSTADAERRASALLGAPGRAAVCSRPEIAANVDRVEDLFWAERLLARK